MKPRFQPKQGKVLEVLEEIANNNQISHVNLVKYKHDIRDFAQYYDGGTTATRAVHITSLSENRAQIELALKNTEQTITEFIGISSLVRLHNSKPAHLFQIDYDSKINLAEFEKFSGKLKKAVERLNIAPEFYVLSSERGYHIYGGVMDYSQFGTFLNILKEEDLADDDWQRIACTRGFGNLRISKNEAKPNQPILIGKIYTA